MKLNFDLELLKADPFKWADSQDLTVRRVNFNFFQKFNNLQKTALYVSIIAIACWVVFGFDSTLSQPYMTLYNLPRYLAGDISFDRLAGIWNYYYGKDMHFSAVCIYGLCYYFLSRHYEKMGIKGSKNVCFSFALTWLSMGLFELYWMSGYSIFQGQSWVLKLQMPQLKIVVQNVFATLTTGGLTALYMVADSCNFAPNGDVIGRRWRFNWGKRSLILLGITAVFALGWIYYPFNARRISVTYETGEVWTSSPMFPQTLYTIDMNPADAENAGEWHYVQDDLVHGWNTLVKVLFTLSIFSMGLIKRVEEK